MRRIPTDEARFDRVSKLAMADLRAILQDMSKFGKRGLTGKHLKGRFGPASNSWRGGRFVGAYGYIYVWVGRAHPMSDRKGYCPEHRLVMYERLRRRLLSTEIVHHKNGNIHDNRIENLEVLGRASHLAEHRAAVSAAMKSAYRNIVMLRRPPRGCDHCGTVFTPKRAQRCARSFCSRLCANSRRRSVRHYGPVPISPRV